MDFDYQQASQGEPDASHLGKLERVKLRESWRREDSHFTQWLALPENLELLGEAIGLNLTLESTEVRVGRFRADILCRDSRSECIVLIENQIEESDHDHLGKLLTYSAGFDARIIIWISHEVKEEHRAAIDWLNNMSVEDVNFFALEIELWRIDRSRPAPRFNIVSKPNSWTKQVATERGRISQNDLAYIDYWEAFKFYLSERNSPVSPNKASAQYWLDMSVIGRGIRLSALAGRRDKYIGVELVIYNDPQKTRIEALRDLVGSDKVVDTYTWDPGVNRIQSKVLVQLNGVDPSDPSCWRDQHEWLADRLEEMHALFSPHTKSI